MKNIQVQEHNLSSDKNRQSTKRGRILYRHCSLPDIAVRVTNGEPVATVRFSVLFQGKITIDALTS